METVEPTGNVMSHLVPADDQGGEDGEQEPVVDDRGSAEGGDRIRIPERATGDGQGRKRRQE